jgi:hypothetical protein
MQIDMYFSKIAGLLCHPIDDILINEARVLVNDVY